MAESNSDSDSNVDIDVSQPHSEGEETPDAFLESLEALEENSWSWVDGYYNRGKILKFLYNFVPLKT